MGASTSIQAGQDATHQDAYARLFDVLDEGKTGYLGARDFVLAFRPYDEASPEGKAIKKVLNCALDIESSSQNRKISKEAWRGVACIIQTDAAKYNISNEDRDILSVEINRVCQRREQEMEGRRELVTGDTHIDEITISSSAMRELREAGVERTMDETGMVPFKNVATLLSMITKEVERGTLTDDESTSIINEHKLTPTDSLDTKTVGPLVVRLLVFLGNRHVADK